MSTHKHTKKLLVAAITTAFMTNSAIGAEFYFGEDDDISLQITSRLSLGSSWRINDADPFYTTSHPATMTISFSQGFSVRLL